MKKTLKVIILNVVAVSLIGTVLTSSMPVLASSPNNLIVFDGGGAYQGLTAEAKELIKSSRKILLKRKEISSKKFRQFESIYHAAHLMRMIKGNMFLYGPPGGAKSYFVNWLLEQEKENPFQIQLHQMMTEQVFIGGQNYESAKQGKYEVNLKGSLADHTTGVIDEMDKGNPATLAALLSLLNERVVYMGGETFKSPLETIFSTSNKNLYEIYADFAANGQGSTADALLNRFSSICFVPNWLEKEDRRALDKEYQRASDNNFHSSSEIAQEEDLELDWTGMRDLAHALFVPTEDFTNMLDDFIDKLRSKSIDFIERQEDQFDVNTIPYYPTVQYTERLRQKVIEVIIMSLTIDFLTSPLTQDIDRLEQTLKQTQGHRFSITPLSLWRSYPILTTVSYGPTKLVIESNGSSHAAIDFGGFLDNYKGENARVSQMIKYIQEERNAFKTSLEDTWADRQAAVVDASSSASILSCMSIDIIGEYQDIERIISLQNGR